MNYDVAPFPWFGSKRLAAPLIWQLLGDPQHYIEPFAGSLAALLNRPTPTGRLHRVETVNDYDGWIVNAWRSIQLSPDETVQAASWPVIEADKMARQLACIRWKEEQDLERLMADPYYHDPIIAGWWIWSVSVQIGSFTGDGAWTVDPSTNKVYKQEAQPRSAVVTRSMPSMVDRGINKYGVRHPGVSREIPALQQRGINKSSTSNNATTDPVMPEAQRWIRHLSTRLRHVRILNGDWTRATSNAVVYTLEIRSGTGYAAVLLDPPYDAPDTNTSLYTNNDTTLSAASRIWARDNATDKLRIVIAGYDTEHDELLEHGWTKHEWTKPSALGTGYNKDNANRDRLWASPHCTPTRTTPTLFEL